MQTILHRLFALLSLCLAATAWGATAPPLDPTGGRVEDRQALRVLLDRMEKATAALDIGAATALMHPEIVLTWQNAEVSKGPAQIRAYYERMLTAPRPTLKAYGVKASLSAPAVFHGDSAIAWGTTEETYELTEGPTFVLKANWSATAVKQDGEWKIAALHFSSNLFDNPLLDDARRFVWIAGAAGLFAGLAFAWLLVRLVGRRQ